MKLSKYEQETVIIFNAGDDEASIYTRDKSVMRKLDKLVAEFPNCYQLEDFDDISKTYSTSKSSIKYRIPRNITDADREQRRQRMQHLNSHDN